MNIGWSGKTPTAVAAGVLTCVSPSERATLVHMNDASHLEGNFNVATYPHAGRLDEIGQAETNRDLRIIKQYIEAEEYTKTQRPDKSVPSIARNVLVSVWERPRVGFHREEFVGHSGLAFGSKLLLIPWSAEALERMKLNKSVADLVLEHVTPVEALWSKLRELHKESDTYEDWVRSAQWYLNEHYTLAVITKEQAKAIDAAGFKTRGFPNNPFARYVAASAKISQNAAPGKATVQFDVERFCHPGFA